MKKSKTFYKLAVRIAIIIILIAAMTVVTYAYYAMSSIRADDNTFVTGLVDIDLNGGIPVVDDIENIEPGATYVREFYIRNNSTDVGGVYYKLYFEDITGVLADVLIVTVAERDSGEVLLSGKMTEFNSWDVEAFDEPLALGETRWFTLTLHYPVEEGNRGMGTKLEFTISADAVQTKNNPDKSFE